MELGHDIGKRDALLVTDVQNDFLPGGALGIEGGEKVIEPLNFLAREFQKLGAVVYLSRDWHPVNHCSFRQFGGPWPPHCIQGTTGAEFSSRLDQKGIQSVISKASDPNKEAYSVLDGTDFEKRLQAERIQRIFVGGLATEYCVLNTVLDARRAGFEVVVVRDAICGISEFDSKQALEKIEKSGAKILSTKEIFQTYAHP